MVGRSPREPLSDLALTDRSADFEIRDDRQVVARETREPETAAMGGEKGERAAIVDAVERASGEERRVGAERSARGGVGRRSEVHPLSQERHEEGSPVVEVPSHETGGVY